MSVYKRFVSYMFSYENGRKKDNVGYARIENYNDECRIHIHIKDMVKREQKASVYLFYREEGRMQGIFIKEMRILDGIGECKITTDSKNLGDSGCDFETVGGIIVYITANRFWGTEWDDKPIYGFEPEDLKIESTEAKEPKEEVQAEAEECENAEEALELEEKEVELRAAVLEEQEELREVDEDYYEKQMNCSWSQVNDGANVKKARDCFEGYTKLYPFYEPEKECIGITPQELREISPLLEEWIDNDFVRYGYNRFRHIILLRKKGEFDVCFIGVPGMLWQEEERAAATYGFDKFVPMRKEKADYGDFGYWCKEVKL